MKFITKSGASIFSEIKFLYEKFGQREFNIWDDLFIVNKQVITEFCSLIIDNNLDISWKCHSRVDIINPETIDLIKKAGCTHLHLGIESGNNRVLDDIGKGIDLEKIEYAFKIIKDGGLGILAFFMIGFPDETKEEIRDTIDLIKKVAQFGEFVVSPYAPIRGTELYERILNYGIELNDPLEFDAFYKKQNVTHGINDNEYFDLVHQACGIPHSYINKTSKTSLESWKSPKKLSILK